jgi:hypothetical protein
MIELGRRLRRGTQTLAVAAALAAGTVGLTSAQSAFAAGTTGSLSQAYCGWHLVPGYSEPYKVSTVWLPAVTGISSAYQHVWLHVEFMQPQNGVWQLIHSYDFNTYARSGAWSTSWTWKDGRSYSTAEDAPGDSGFAGDAFNPNTYVRVTAYWYSGNSLVGGLSEWATNLKDPAYPNVCNFGQNYA